MIHRLKEGLRKLLGARYVPLVAACLGVILASGTIGAGLQFDDYFHQFLLEQGKLISEEGSVLTAMFSFCDGSDEQFDRRLRIGRFPWWTAKEIKIAFFRPVTAFTHWLDYRLWPAKPSLMHLHSLAWFAALIIAATLVYRRTVSPLWVAGLAGLLFAIDDAHGIPVGWLANRNALVAATFGFFTLVCHDRWRRDGWRAGAVWAPLLFLTSLLSAEAGLGIGAYLFAYELFLGSGDWRKRAVCFAPYALVVVVWWGAYKAMGYGTFASGGYIDPGSEPLSYLRHLVERVPVLLHGQWFFPDAMIYGYLPKPFAYGVLAVICFLLAGLAILFFPLLRRDAVARFFALGMVLSLLPVCATFPDNRLLLFPGFGAMGVLAKFLGFWFERAAWWPTNLGWRILARVAVVVLVLIHLIAAPLLLPLHSRGLVMFTAAALERPLAQVSRAQDITGKTLVFINPPNAFSVGFSTVICRELGLQQPKTAYALSSGSGSPMTVRRVDAQSLEIVPDVGFISIHLDRLYRGQTHPMQVGDRVQTDDMTAEVLSLTEDRRPLRVRFTFSHPLDDSSFAFLAWNNDRKGYVPFDMPAIGQSVRLDVAFLSLM